MQASVSFADVLRDAARLLAFRRTSSAPALHWRAFLAFGLGCTWLAGVGRYWDHPRAALWQHLGLGSIAYVLCLSALLWLLLRPLRPRRWWYRNVLVFVTLTSPPALLYAIPVERFLSMDAAQATNAWFLAVVAGWRVALLVLFLRRVAELRWFALLVATLLPLTLIVAALALLNLEHAVFEIMAGISPPLRTGGDLAYLVVLALTLVSLYAFPVLAIAYVVLVVQAQRAPAERIPTLLPGTERASAS
jgi:hypothetical protein